MEEMDTEIDVNSGTGIVSANDIGIASTEDIDTQRLAASPEDEHCISVRTADMGNDTESTDGNLIVNVKVELPSESELPSEWNVCADTENHPRIGRVDERVCCFINNDAKITPSPVLQYVLDVDQPYDIVISCADGKIGAHRLVLRAASPFVGEMFCDYNHRLGEVAVLIVPDIPVRVMKIVLNFCYTGKMFYLKEDEPEIMDTMKMLLIGEYADLTMNEVTIKATLPPEPEPSTSTATEQVEQHQSESVILSASNNDACGEEQVDEDDDCLTSSDEEEHDDKNSTGEKENICGESQSSRSKNSKDKTGTPELSSTYHYLIIPQLGSHSRKLQCCYCICAFKSLETFSSHLYNIHHKVLKSRKLTEEEFVALSFCDHCKKTHNQISSANQCLSRHNRTRCFICFQGVRYSQFEEHMKSLHPTEEKNGNYVVKCNWCNAGIVFGDQFDNRNMAGHCYSQHFQGSGNSSIETIESTEVSTPKVKFSMPTDREQHQRAGSSSPSVTLPSCSTSHLSLTPSVSSSSQKDKRPVPAVLALLQKASLKRKSVQEPLYHQHIKIENPEKRARVDPDVSNPRKQIAKRTGTPVGRLVKLDQLQNGVPTFKGKVRGKVTSVTVDVGRLSNVYVQFNYDKSFIEDLYSKVKNTDVKLPTTEMAPSFSNFSTGSLQIHSRSRSVDPRDCSFRCSMPLL
ncbi:unnamed protein product [Orchesella dallaii]|uniref:BTB domain-containing protein n=1 Tax=Orchesella dallaii TaxID=48710 RepID=A0ABP1QSW7_9HEXA